MNRWHSVIGILFAWVLWGQEVRHDTYARGDQEHVNRSEEWWIKDAYDTRSECHGERTKEVAWWINAEKKAGARVVSDVDLIMSTKEITDDVEIGDNALSELLKRVQDSQEKLFGKHVKVTHRLKFWCLPAGTDPRPRSRD
jgi:hypothetical protein